MKNAHLTRILEHNRNRETDLLYAPLRETLIKRSLSKDKNDMKFISPQPIKSEVKYSKLSNKVREISSKQAQEMQNNIYIPASRKLIPTQDLKRVSGKKFSAVNVNVKYSRPISQEEFQLRNPNQEQHILQTVYEVTSNPTSQQVSAMQSPQISGSVVNQEAINEYQLPIPKHQQAQPLILKNHSMFSQAKQEQNTQSELKKTHQYHGNSQQQSRISLERKYSRSGRAKSNYKYNLFSALDEGANTKCATCWVQNQIVATRPSNQPWD